MPGSSKLTQLHLAKGKGIYFCTITWVNLLNITWQVCSATVDNEEGVSACMHACTHARTHVRCTPSQSHYPPPTAAFLSCLPLSEVRPTAKLASGTTGCVQGCGIRVWVSETHASSAVCPAASGVSWASQGLPGVTG